MQDNGVRTQTIRLAEATPHPENYNEHDTVQLARLRGSLAAFGYVRRIVVQEHADGSGYTLVAGHGVAEALEASGYEEVEATVLPSDWSYEKVMAYLVADNELAKLAQSDNEQLARLLQHLEENAPELVEATGYDDERLDALMREIGAANTGGHDIEDGGIPGEDDDELAKLRQKWGVEPGQLWQLNSHRLICGDSTDAAVVQRLMGDDRARLFSTDPPYLVDYDGTNHPHKWGEEDKNKDWRERYTDWDKSSQDGAALYEGFISAAMAHAITHDAAWYCWHAARNHKLLEEVWESFGVLFHQQIVWAKDRPVLTRSWYMWQHEPCMFGWVRGNKPFRAQNDYPPTVWQLPTTPPGKSTLHPTQKPIEVFTLPMLQHTLPGDVCYEPFSGSGSQIMAGEKTGRRVFAIEKEPVFVAAALERWHLATGETPVIANA